MPKQVYINLPVKDLQKATEFYSALGFVKNEQWSNQDASCMKFSDDIFIMLLTHSFYSKFTNKSIPDLTKNSSVLISLSVDSKEAVQQFADTAKSLGGDYFEADFNKQYDFLFTLEVTDLDGHTLEPNFMDTSKFPTL